MRALARWLSLRLPAHTRARLWRFFAASSSLAPPASPPAPTSFPSLRWRRIPLLLAGTTHDPELEGLTFFEPLAATGWPSFLTAPADTRGERIRVFPLCARNGFAEAAARQLPQRWAAPLGLILPVDRQARNFAADLAKATGYPLGPTLPELLARAGSDKALPASPLEHQLTRLFPLVSILLVTYNQQELTDWCLRSLYEFTDYPNFEVVVVDNASRDGTVEVLRRWQENVPNFRVHCNTRNVGFPQACNQAASMAAGELLCLLNNDTVLAPGWLSALVDELMNDSRVGLVGPVSNGVSNEARVSVPFFSLEALPLWSLDRCRRFFRRSRPMTMLAFFCVLTWRRVWEQVGGLDPAFGLGLFEDDDFSFRVRQAGYQLRCRLDAYVHHFLSSSFSLLSDTSYLRVYEHNRKLFLQKKRRLRSLK